MLIFWISPPFLFYMWGREVWEGGGGGERGPQKYPCLDMKNQISYLSINANTFYFPSLGQANPCFCFCFCLFCPKICMHKSTKGVFFSRNRMYGVLYVIFVCMRPSRCSHLLFPRVHPPRSVIHPDHTIRRLLYREHFSRILFNTSPTRPQASRLVRRRNIRAKIGCPVSTEELLDTFKLSLIAGRNWDRYIDGGVMHI